MMIDNVKTLEACKTKSDANLWGSRQPALFICTAWCTIFSNRIAKFALRNLFVEAADNSCMPYFFREHA